MEFDRAWYTHPGSHHQNQDALEIAEEPGSFLAAALCDGLGGMGGGREAGQFCAHQTIGHLHDAVFQLRADGPVPEPGMCDRPGTGEPGANLAAAAITQTAAAFAELQSQDAGLVSARSTALALALTNRRLDWATIGDTRLYHFRSGHLATVSPDDSAGHAAFERGEVDHEGIRMWPGRGILTTCLGEDLPIEPHFGTVETQNGDAILACTDGLWQYVWDLEIEIDLVKSASAAEWLDAMLVRLVERSHLDGDNLTALAVIVEE
ncbi:MAG: protein phosphatase 2C domain-containing protein [Bifidobacteriaceae bacterium]|nr:protein phosphatase 2C domain-containing protein [Bifidobacteriaceae bacterium]